jgi:hypothetical protein
MVAIIWVVLESITVMSPEISLLTNIRGLVAGFLPSEKVAGCARVRSPPMW